jgi:hypothetical protein
VFKKLEKVYESLDFGSPEEIATYVSIYPLHSFFLANLLFICLFIIILPQLATCDYRKHIMTASVFSIDAFVGDGLQVHKHFLY